MLVWSPDTQAVHGNSWIPTWGETYFQMFLGISKVLFYLIDLKYSSPPPFPHPFGMLLMRVPRDRRAEIRKTTTVEKSMLFIGVQGDIQSRYTLQINRTLFPLRRRLTLHLSVFKTTFTVLLLRDNKKYRTWFSSCINFRLAMSGSLYSITYRTPSKCRHYIKKENHVHVT